MSQNNDVQGAVFTSLLPARKSDRIYGTWDLIFVQICFGIAAWFFLTGSQAGVLLPAYQAIPVILFGNCTGIFLISFLSIVPTRYGCEEITVSKGVFGHKGSFLMLFFFLIACYPALALATLMFGESAIKFVHLLGGTGMMAEEGMGVTIFALFALIGGTIIAGLGPNVMRWFTRISAVSMAVILFGLMVYVFVYHGFSAIWHAEPCDTTYIDEYGPDLGIKWNKATALEANLGLGMSWGFFFGGWSRLAKTEPNGYHGCQWGWGALAAGAGLFSAFAALAISEYDPTAWFIKVSHDTNSTILPLAGIVLFAVANLTSVATLVYPEAVAFKAKLPKYSWIVALLVSTVPVLAMLNNTVYYMVSNVYAFIGLVTGCFSAIMVADFLVISKGKFRIREYFSKKGYWYAKGWNPAAIIALACGLTTYLIILNPLTWVSYSGLFPYTTAILPTICVTGAVYIILMKTWILKKYKMPYVNDFEIEDEKAE